MKKNLPSRKHCCICNVSTRTWLGFIGGRFPAVICLPCFEDYKKFLKNPRVPVVRSFVGNALSLTSQKSA